MEKEFIPYQIAVDIKSIGFDEPCFGAWVNNELFITENENPKIQSLSINQCTAPLYQQAFRFFREKYNLHSTIALISNSDTERRYMVMIDYIYPHKAIMEFEEYETHEEAELECLIKLIKIVKNK